MSADRYARQVIVRGVGPTGQARIRQGTVQVRGSGLDAEVAALYLVGAGVGTLLLDPGLLARCQDLNPEVVLIPTPGSGPFQVEVDGRAHQPEEAEPVAAGSRGARWALARLLSGAAP